MKVSLFPYNKVPKGSSIVIYPAGDIGQEFVRQVKFLGYCDIAGLLDKNYSKKAQIKIMAPESICNLNFDYVVIASYKYKNEISSKLINEFTVPKEKIILLDNEPYNFQQISPVRDWTGYYIDAEASASEQYNKIMKPIFEKYSLINKNMRVMDFACGRGRIADVIKDDCQKIYLCDISTDALDYCKQRFKNCANVETVVNMPEKIPLDSNILEFIYSWDAMVHFNYKLIDIYVEEFFRLLKSGGYCFLHHSDIVNCQNDSSENFYENISWRANISKQDVAKIARRSGFEVVEQISLDWEGAENLDCISILQKN